MPVSHTPFGPVYWSEEFLDDSFPAVVLLHGLGGGSGFWSAEQKELSRKFRVIAIELRGSGVTPSGPEHLSIEKMARDVICVLDDLGVGSAHIVGFSMGGMVAQSIASSFPDRIRSLVLAGAFATTNIQSRLFLKAVGSCYRNSITEKQMFEIILPWLFSRKFLASECATPFLSFPEGPPDNQRSGDWIRSLDAQLCFDGRPNLSKIKTRTLIMCGTNDSLAPPSDAEELKQGIDGAILCMIPGGHLFNIESPIDFIENLQGFLSSSNEIPA